MNKAKFRVGDKVKVVGMPPIKFAPGVKDEIGTKKLFKSMLGKVYTVRGFDEIGNVELRPKRSDTVWIEQEFLRLRGEKPRRPGRNECWAWETGKSPKYLAAPGTWAISRTNQELTPNLRRFHP